jgi:hypothetical protein
MDLRTHETTVARLLAELAGLRWRQAHHEDVEVAVNAVDAALGAAYSRLARQAGDLSAATLASAERRLRVHLLGALRAAVEQDAEVSALRNRLDSRRAYLAVVGPRPDGILSDPDPQRRAAYIDWRTRLGAQMKPDLLRLMRRRQERARDLGYADYPSLMLTVQETPPELLTSLFAELADALGPANPSPAGPTDADTEASATDGDAGGPAGGAVLTVPEAAAVVAEVRCGFAALGRPLPEAQVEVLIGRQELAVGCTLAVAPSRAAKVVLTPLPRAEFASLAWHEFGHAAHYLCLPADPTFGLIDAGFDETVATYFEGMAGNPDAASRAAELAETRRLLASHWFELAAYADLDADLDQVHARIETGIRGLPTPANAFWAADSFRSTDPMYIQNYLVARLVAAALRACAWQNGRGDSDEAVSAAIWQQCTVGMAVPWLERLTALCGERISAAPFAQELQGGGVGDGIPLP